MANGMIATSTPDRTSSTHAPSLLRSVDLAGPAGRLEAILNEGSPDAPFAAVVCHPHPSGGGSMHNKVVYHAMKALNHPAFGLRLPVLRFNFRGTGLSQGRHDGRAEAADVQAAIRWLENEYKLPIVACGFSFGAAMALAAGCASDSPSNVCALAALGLPLEAEGRSYAYKFLDRCTLPKLFLSGDRDPYATVAQLEQVAAMAAFPKQLLIIPGGDHFFAGPLGAMQQALADWLHELLFEGCRKEQPL
jgi:alpha/beta superfamily hydrolase